MSTHWIRNMTTQELMLSFPTYKNPFAENYGDGVYGVPVTVQQCILRVHDFDRAQCEAALQMQITSKRLLKAIQSRLNELPTPTGQASEPEGDDHD